jgi:hypothetical protein
MTNITMRLVLAGGKRNDGDGQLALYVDFIIRAVRPVGSLVRGDASPSVRAKSPVTKASWIPPRDGTAVAPGPRDQALLETTDGTRSVLGR